MKTRIWKCLALLIAVTLLPISAVAETQGTSATVPTSSAVQIRAKGDTKNQDGVLISKTIEGTGYENLFDITLQVKTWHSLEELKKGEDAAVVIVMDISNTMNDQMSDGNRRLPAAKTAAKSFVDEYCKDNMLLGANRELGFVSFNRDATTELALTKAESGKADGWVESIEALEASDEFDEKWTNLEGGLQLAKNLLDGSNARHKFILLITDGFPTTYLGDDVVRTSKTELAGLHPETFYDQVKINTKTNIRGVLCNGGTSYSETGARKARQVAADIRNKSNIDVFSIGVGLGSKIKVGEDADGNPIMKPDTIQTHIDRITWNSSVVERPYDVIQNGYEIGDADDPDSYKQWLGGKSQNGGIGGGPNFTSLFSDDKEYEFGAYRDAHDTETMKKVFGDLLGQIEEINTKGIENTWIATDPMGEYVEFQEFLNLGKNEASFDTTKNQLQWKLLSSPYIESQEGNKTYYTYTLKYRVRLKNEASGFDFATLANIATETDYETNGSATLHYKVKEYDAAKKQEKLSEDKYLSFAKPAVEGYQGELTFWKTTTETGESKAHEGAQFRLVHDTDCTCKNFHKGAVTIAEKTATSDANGKVTISDIPSGHCYTLTETNAGAYSTQTYHVNVSYSTVTLTNKEDKENKPVATIVNELKPITITLPAATKTMDSKAPAADRFSFELRDAQNKLLQTKTNDAQGNVRFDAIKLNTLGEHTYTIREVKGQEEQVAYCNTVYTVTVTVTKTETGCTAELKEIKKDGQSYTGALTFANLTATPSPNPSGSPDPSDSPNPSGSPNPSSTPSPNPSPTPPSQERVPKTGDDSQLLLWGLLLAASLLITVITLSPKKKS